MQILFVLQTMYFGRKKLNHYWLKIAANPSVLCCAAETLEGLYKSFLNAGQPVDMLNMYVVMMQRDTQETMKC